MSAYNVLDARNNLSRLIAEAESGLEVTIMRRGRPVARLVPVSGDAPARPGSGAAIAEWLAAHPLPDAAGRTPAQIESDIAEMRRAGV